MLDNNSSIGESSLLNGARFNRDWSSDYDPVTNDHLGRGSFGNVYLIQSREGKRYAIKHINLKQTVLKLSQLNRVYALDEGTKLMQLNLKHENIVAYYASYLYNEQVSWIMEYCDGGTIKNRILLYIRFNNKFDENLIWFWAIHMLRGIRYLHQHGVIHRDLKPDNIYISGKNGACKIGDFGFAKIVDTSTPSVLHNSYDDEKEISLACKLINISHVGTPSYMAPELRRLIQCHLEYKSMASVKKSENICIQHVFKADIFSFGCILYEMAALKMAFENRFEMPTAIDTNQMIGRTEMDAYSNDLKFLIKSCLDYEPHERFSIQEIWKLNFLLNKETELNGTLYNAYLRQLVPKLNNSNGNNVIECRSSSLEEHFRPVAMTTLNFNSNMIVVLANKHINAPISGESRLLVYDEFLNRVRVFNSFLRHFDMEREPFAFKTFNMCVDEANDHVYILTSKYGLLRFSIVKTNFYFEDIVYDGQLSINLNEVVIDLDSYALSQIHISCFVPVDTNPAGSTRHLVVVYSYQDNELLVRMQVRHQSCSNETAFLDRSVACDITGYTNMGSQQNHIKQMISTSTELVCLYDNPHYSASVIKIFDVRSLRFIRAKEHQVDMNSINSNLCCLTKDSSDSFYTTDNRYIYNYDITTFKKAKLIKVLKFISESNRILFMRILTNGKFVLITDALQMETSSLYILKAVSKSRHGIE